MVHGEKDLKELSGIGKSTMTRLKNCENTTMEVMDKVCNVVQVTMVEAVKIIKDEGERLEMRSFITTLGKTIKLDTERDGVESNFDQDKKGLVIPLYQREYK